MQSSVKRFSPSNATFQWSWHPKWSKTLGIQYLQNNLYLLFSHRVLPYRRCLQMTMLDTAHTVLGSSSPFNAPSIAATMAESMFQALFLVWIRSEITTQEMWLEFSRKVSSLVAWKASVDEWKVCGGIAIQLALPFKYSTASLLRHYTGKDDPAHLHLDRSFL